MDKRRIGSLEVSVVGLGCNNFGRRVDAAGTADIVSASIDAGINFFDTADIYGGTKSEEFLGQALGNRRGKVLVATKFGHKVDEERQGARPEYVRQAAEDSLRRLGTDYIDLYQLHTPDANTPIADTLGALNDLVQAGKVREIGCSNFSVDQLREAEEAAKGGARFVSVQNEYSMLRRDPENGVLDECQRLGLGFLPYFPLASGLLTGKYRKGHPIPGGTRIQEGSDWLTEENLDLVERLIAFAEGHGRSLLDLAFAWLLAQPTVSSVIAGATSTQQVQANAATASWSLNESDLTEVNGILGHQ